MPYRLGVDLGTTFTAAAAAIEQLPPTMVGLGNRAVQIPSVLFGQSDGTFLIGEAAERRGLTEPDKLVREVKRRIGDDVPIVVNGTPYSSESLMARLLRWVVELASQRMGEAPETTMLTHPANWGPFKLESLDRLVALADVGPVLRCTEPEAAAAQYVSRAQVSIGHRFVVYDLGGGTFDTCILEKTERGFRLVGQPEGVDHLGGVDFDEAVFQHVMTSLGPRVRDLDSNEPAATLGLARLRRDCVEAKEALSGDVDVTVPVTLPGAPAMVRLTRSELESKIRPTLVGTIAAVRRTLRSAGVQPADLRAIVLIGGSSRIPLVGEMLEHELGITTALDTHPKHDVALGAALLARAASNSSALAADGHLPARLEIPSTPEPVQSQEPPGRPAGSTREVTVAAKPGRAALSRAAATPARPRAPMPPHPAGSTSTQSPHPGGDSASTGWSASEEHGSRRTARPLVALVGAAAAAGIISLIAYGVFHQEPGTEAGPGNAMSTGPTSAIGDSPSPKAAPAKRPLNGGSYTWANGVTLKTSIRTVELWGISYRHCAGASCLIAKPADLRMVLRYSVVVPASYQGSFDPSACLPSTTSVGRKAALTTGPASYTDLVTGPISPGASKSGTVDYSVKKDATPSELQLQSRCGGTAHNGEQVIFAGKVPSPSKKQTPKDVGEPALKREYFTVRVDQIQSDKDRRTLAALVETCLRKKLPSQFAKNPSALPKWSAVTTKQQRLRPIKKWRTLRPPFPYGGYEKKQCVSGWLAFRVPEKSKVYRIDYTDTLGEFASWLVGKAPVIGTRPTYPPPTRTPSVRPPTTRKPIPEPRPKPSSRAPSFSQEPTQAPSRSRPSKSTR